MWRRFQERRRQAVTPWWESDEECEKFAAIVAKGSWTYIGLIRAAARKVAAEFGHVQNCNCHKLPGQTKGAAWRCLSGSAESHAHPFLDLRCCAPGSGE